jgi:hypothetical protein
VPHWPPRFDAVPSGTTASSTPCSRSPERYLLQGGGPLPASDDVEQRARLAIEVVVLWRGDVLAVGHLAPPGAFFVGGPNSSCDLALPIEQLGAEGLCVAVGSRSEVSAVLPAQARGWRTLPDGSTRPLEPSSGASLASRRSPSTERLVPLGPGQRAHLCFGDIEIQVAPVAAGRAPRRRRSIGFEPATLAYFGLSSLSVAGVLALLSRMAPPLGLTPDERAESERLYLVQSYLAASAERVEQLRAQQPAKSPPAALAAHHASPAPAARSEDEAEAEQAAPAPPELPEDAEATPPTARERRRAIEDARSFGMIESLRRNLEALNDPRLVFHRELDSETTATMQQLFGSGRDPMGDEGPGGLSLSSTGLRGGDQGNLIALGAVRTAGGGEGGELERLSRVSRFTGSHQAPAPQLRPSDGLASGGLPVAAVRSTVHAHWRELRQCYEQGLASDPLLAGSATVRFVVQSDGQVEQANVADTALPSGVRGCIESVFRGLTFPHPESSPVNVAYPIEFALSSSER